MMVKKKGCWKKIKQTGYPARWDKGTHVLVVNKIDSRNGKYEVMHSHATGGWHSIGIEKTKKEAIDKAVRFMGKQNIC